MFEELKINDHILLSNNFYSGIYDQFLFLKRSMDDGSGIPKYYIEIRTYIENRLVLQGYLYFYLDFIKKKSYFIGIKVEEQFKGLNIASLLLASYIDICFKNGYDYFGVNSKQRKPFLLYMLKTFGFEIEDMSLYNSRKDVISIYKNELLGNKRKFLLFKSLGHELTFLGTNIYKNDNYEIIHNGDGFIFLDKVIMPLQNFKSSKVSYQMIDYDKAKEKSELVLSRHIK